MFDPSPERLSACPVHFLWDGRGRGRVFVRSGFLGFLASAMLMCCGRMVHIDAFTTAGMVLAVSSASAWIVGQLRR